jgi:hypothetical protein
MFEKINWFAETMGTGAGHSRRGFLELAGKGALSLASLVGGFLLLHGEARANVCPGSCHYLCPDGSLHSTNCGSGCTCDLGVDHGGMLCELYRERCGYY